MTERNQVTDLLSDSLQRRDAQLEEALRLLSLARSEIERLRYELKMANDITNAVREVWKRRAEQANSDRQGS